MGSRPGCCFYALGLPDGFRQIPQPCLPPSLLLKAPPQLRGSVGGGEPQRGQTAPVSCTCLCPPWACCQLPGSRPDGSLVLTRGQELEEASCPEEGRTEKAGQREAHRMAWVADLANGSWLLFLL